MYNIWYVMLVTMIQILNQLTVDQNVERSIMVLDYGSIFQWLESWSPWFEIDTFIIWDVDYKKNMGLGGNIGPWLKLEPIEQKTCFTC